MRTWVVCGLALQAPGDALEVGRVVEPRGRDLEVGIELVQVPAQAALVAGAVFDEIVAVVDEQADLVLDPRQRRLRQMRFADRGAGDGQRVDRIGLAELPAGLALARHQLGRNAQHLLASLEQVMLQAAAEVARVLDGPHALVVERDRPVQQLLVAVVASLDGELIEQLGGLAVDRGCGVRGLVGVHADDHHLLQPLSCR
jgi:hypothetical protein